MVLSTGNPYLDALGGTPWPKTPQNTGAGGALVLDVFFDQDPNHSTGGAWTDAEESAFSGALHAWSSVANVHFLEVEPQPGDQIDPAAVDLWELKVTDAEIPGFLGQSTFPDDPKFFQDDQVFGPGPTHIDQFNTSHFWTAANMQPGGILFETFVHELGHGLGLAHPFDQGDGTGLFPGIKLKPDGSANPTDLGDNGLKQHSLYGHDVQSP